MLDDEPAEAHGLRKGPPLGNESSRGACILVVANDAALRNRVIDYLEDYNLHAMPGAGRRDIARQLSDSEPSLVILDLERGQESQFDLLGEIRACSDVPVIDHRRPARRRGRPGPWAAPASALCCVEGRSAQYLLGY